jgi:hypothetical protein
MQFESKNTRMGIIFFLCSLIEYFLVWIIIILNESLSTSSTFLETIHSNVDVILYTQKIGLIVWASLAILCFLIAIDRKKSSSTFYVLLGLVPVGLSFPFTILISGFLIGAKL